MGNRRLIIATDHFIDVKSKNKRSGLLHLIATLNVSFLLKFGNYNIFLFSYFQMIKTDLICGIGHYDLVFLCLHLLVFDIRNKDAVNLTNYQLFTFRNNIICTCGF